MKKIILVEDDTVTSHMLSLILERAGYAVLVANSYAAFRTLDKAAIDSYILDIRLPDGDGISLCQEIREKSDVPILMLTASDDEDSVVKAFQLGADDYVVKPFRTRELLARLNAIEKRNLIFNKENVYESEKLILKLDDQTVVWDGKIISLTEIERSILVVLLKHSQKRVGRNQILTVLEANKKEVLSDGSLSVYMSRLRKKLKDAGCRDGIETCWGSGYRWKFETKLR